MKARYDVVIAGARVAGASTAMLLARQGLRVLVIERGRYGTDTLSTHALMRGGVLQLARWGLLDAVRASNVPPSRTTAFHYAGEVVEVTIKPRDGVDALYAPRRYVLDTILEDAAVAAGAEVVHGARVVDLVRSPRGRVTGVVVERPDHTTVAVDAPLVVGADGVHSTVARLAGAEPYRTAAHMASVVYGYFAGVGLGGVHWYYQRGVTAGAIPTNDGLTCMFAGTTSRRFMEEIRFDLAQGHRRILEETDGELASRVAAGRLEGNLHGFAGQKGYMRQSWGPGWALVGDAAYFKDPITAHGMTDAMRDAELLANAAVEGTDAALARYQAIRDELSLGLFEVTDEIASFDWDLETVREKHLRLSREMKKEVEWLSDRSSAAPGRAGAPTVLPAV